MSDEVSDEVSDKTAVAAAAEYEAALDAAVEEYDQARERLNQIVEPELAEVLGTIIDVGKALNGAALMELVHEIGRLSEFMHENVVVRSSGTGTADAPATD